MVATLGRCSVRWTDKIETYMKRGGRGRVNVGKRECMKREKWTFFGPDHLLNELLKGTGC